MLVLLLVRLFTSPRDREAGHGGFHLVQYSVSLGFPLYPHHKDNFNSRTTFCFRWFSERGSGVPWWTSLSLAVQTWCPPDPRTFGSGPMCHVSCYGHKCQQDKGDSGPFNTSALSLNGGGSVAMGNLFYLDWLAHSHQYIAEEEGNQERKLSAEGSGSRLHFPMFKKC